MRRFSQRQTAVALGGFLLLLVLALRVTGGESDDDSRHSYERNNGYGGGAYVPEPALPAGIDVFNLTLEETRAYSQRYNYEVVGHSYFHGFQTYMTAAAIAAGQGAGFNTPRVYDGIGYFGGAGFYASIIADVHDPRNMQPLSVIPCDPGTRCLYHRVDPVHHLMVIGMDATTGGANNPITPPGGCTLTGSGAGLTCAQAISGWAVYDVSNPRQPKRLGFVATGNWSPNGPLGNVTAKATHGLDLDGRYAYVCAEVGATKLPVNGLNMEVLIIDYGDPAHPAVVSSFHVQGQHTGETFAPQDQVNPDGTPQLPYCHEINYYQNRIYVAYRDAGMIILDVTDRNHPTQISRFDYVPPYNGGSLGASHTYTPVGFLEWESVKGTPPTPSIAINTDENFGCPPGFGRVMDITDLANPQVLSTYRMPISDDNFNRTTETFTCLAGQQTSHHPWFDVRSSSLFHQAWYRHGVRAWNIANPYLPQEVGYYLGPPYAGANGRTNREVFQDTQTGLIWVSDGGGGGMTALRYTGPIPPSPPLPGAR
jgi:hypothetical protein